MKKVLIALIVSIGFTCFQAFAHHAADGVVDDETYALIEELVSTTPHAEMTLEDLAMGVTEITIVVDNYPALADLLDGGLVEFVDYLHGMTNVIVTETTGGGYIVTIITHGEDYNYNEDNNSSWEDAAHQNPNS